MFRLLTVSHYFPAHGGGIEIVAQHLVNEFQRNGITVQWLASDTDLAPSVAGPGITYTPIAATNFIENLSQLPYPIWSPTAFSAIWRAIGGATVVHIHEHVYFGSITALILARLRGRPIVITQHAGSQALPNLAFTTIYEAATRLLARVTFHLATRTVFISENVRGFFGRLGDPRSRLIFNGIDVRRFTVCSAQVRTELREALSVPKDQKVALFVGRFAKKKGIQTIGQLAQRFPDVLWLLAGSGPEDPGQWRRPNVRVIGRIDNEQLPRYYQLADLLVLPSYSEGFPLVVQEALACGLGVLSTDEVASACRPVSGDIRSCPTSRTGGRLDDWEAALRAVLQDDTYLADRAGRSMTAHEQWSWNHCASQYLGLFAEIAGGGRP